jgi:hypothetical protein
MNPIITKETVDNVIKGSEGLQDLAKTGYTTMVDETIKLYVFYGVVGILKAAVAFIVFGIIWKYLEVLNKAEITPVGLNKALKTSSLIIAIVYFAAVSTPHILDIGKAVVAPNLFLAEKGAALVKGK